MTEYAKRQIFLCHVVQVRVGLLLLYYNGTQKCVHVSVSFTIPNINERTPKLSKRGMVSDCRTISGARCVTDAP